MFLSLVLHQHYRTSRRIQQTVHQTDGTDQRRHQRCWNQSPSLQNSRWSNQTCSFPPTKSHVLYETVNWELMAYRRYERRHPTPFFPFHPPPPLLHTERRVWAVNYVEAKEEGMIHAEPKPTTTTGGGASWWWARSPRGTQEEGWNGSNADTGNSVSFPTMSVGKRPLPLERRTRGRWSLLLGGEIAGGDAIWWYSRIVSDLLRFNSGRLLHT